MLASNGTLTLVSSVSGTDDYAAPPSSTVKWSGATDCYLDQRTVRITTPEGSDYQRAWKVYLQIDQPPVQIQIGDLLTVEQQGRDGATAVHTLPVMSVDDRQQQDMPADVQTSLYYVEPSSTT